jgi:exosortase/archaeosortase family protein
LGAAFGGLAIPLQAFEYSSDALGKRKLRVSLTLTSERNFRSQTVSQQGNLTVPQFSFLASLLTLAACAADQFIAPALYSTSPLWAAAVCTALVWMRGDTGFKRLDAAVHFGFSFERIVLFVAAHALLLSSALLLPAALEQLAGTVSPAGWVTAGLKLSVLLPTLLLLPRQRWPMVARTYAAEGIAALIVLFTFFPGRILATIWPWYGQMLGGLVFFISGLFVHALTYSGALTPTIHGPGLDVTILQACSGISGIELFDYLFAFVALLDWNRLRKGRLLLAYFGGIAVMLSGNGLRIVSFVVLGNHGFAEVVARFHLTAGSIFFSLLFLVYLSSIYRKLLVPRETVVI